MSYLIEHFSLCVVSRDSQLSQQEDLMYSCSSLSCAADNDKSAEDRQKEEELLQQIHKLVETRDFLVDDVEFERLRCAPSAWVLLPVGAGPLYAVDE